MPDWLINSDNYIPSKDKNGFINKTILSILTVISRLKLQTESKTGKIKLNPSIKILATILLIVFVSLSRKIAFVILIDAILLFIVSLFSADEIKYILKVGFAVSCITFLILIPSVLMGNINNSILIVLKVAASTAAVNIVSLTTKWDNIIRGLKVFLIPDIFIFVIDITIKYIAILGDFSLNLLYSLKLRSVGKLNKKTEPMSGIMGTMFIKSKEMADEMYEAMECRCFTGEYKQNKKFEFCIYDALFIILNIGIVFAYFYFDRL